MDASQVSGQVPTYRPPAGEINRRLSALAGRHCPQCGCLLAFDGTRLFCQGCPYGWSNPEAAEDEVLQADRR